MSGNVANSVGFECSFIFRGFGSEGTVLQDGQFAALRNEYLSLNFLRILIFFATKTPNFVNFWPIFL